MSIITKSNFALQTLIYDFIPVRKINNILKNKQKRLLDIDTRVFRNNALRLKKVQGEEELSFYIV